MKTTMYHRIIAAALACILIIYSFKSTSTLVNFMIHQDEIAKTLCVQKDNQIDCFGKCQLIKALKEDLPNRLDFPIQNTQKLLISFDFIQPINTVCIKLFSEVKKNKIIDCYATAVKTIYYDVLTPPPLVS